MNSTNSIYIIDGVRTAIGSPFKGLKMFNVSQMSAVVIEAVLERNQIKKDQVSLVILGNTVSAGTGQNFARHAAYLAGLPVTVPAYKISNVCGSGLQSIISAAQAIWAQDAELVIAGGAESATFSPQIISKDSQTALEDKNVIDSLLHDGLRCALTEKHMGELCEALAAQHNISRREQDEYALQSHQKACQAQAKGKFSQEIVAVKDAQGNIFSADDRPRKSLTMETLEVFSPAFRQGGTITAGNACVPCDGACAVLVAGQDFVQRQHLAPKARLMGYAAIAVKPEDAFAAGIDAIEQCLERSHLKMADIDLFDMSEAFAAQVILTQKKLKIPGEKLNVHGGDIALGHPLGTAGTRSLVTLLHALIDQKKRRGISCVCLGGGGAVAVAIELVAK